MAGRPPGRPRVVSDEAMNALYDPENPHALINRIPDRLKPILERLRQKLPRTLMSSEKDVRLYCSPDERDERVRLSFWDEYNAASACGKQMSLQSIISGTCSWETWVTTYEPNNRKMLWVFTPPVSYAMAMRQILHRGTERLLEIMNLPITDKKGNVDPKVATLILKAWQLADLRIKGGIVQKMQVEQKSVNVNFNSLEGSSTEMRQQVQNMQLEDLETLERRIENAKRDQYRYLKHLGPEQREAILAGDHDTILDIENATRSSQRTTMPDIPELPDIELKLDEVIDAQEENEQRSN
jgi:hypothetical protein